jgi:hypothetical protein
LDFFKKLTTVLIVITIAVSALFVIMALGIVAVAIHPFLGVVYGMCMLALTIMIDNIIVNIATSEQFIDTYDNN